MKKMSSILPLLICLSAVSLGLTLLLLFSKKERLTEQTSLLRDEEKQTTFQKTSPLLERVSGFKPVAHKVLHDTFEELQNRTEKSEVTFHLGPHSVTGTINLRQVENDGLIRFGGSLLATQDEPHGGSFSFSTHADGTIHGRVIRPRLKKVWIFNYQPEIAQWQVAEKAQNEIMCVSLIAPADSSPGKAKPAPVRGQPQALQPSFSSRPNATAVIFLDFDGATVKDPDWNDGKTINAAAPNLTNTQIEQIWRSVAEDFAPFDIDVTTTPSRYDNALPHRRTRCIITPTTTAVDNQSGINGVAYVNSFSMAGKSGGFSATVPCWVIFRNNSNAQRLISDTALTISHEVGHTLGLSHDGDNTSEYYSGHGSGVLSWGPIMGNPYGRNMTHWSQGEYSNASNLENDHLIITKSANGFGFINDEGPGKTEAGDTNNTAVTVNQTSDSFTVTGIISTRPQGGTTSALTPDADRYKFQTRGGNLSFTLTPAANNPNLRAKISLLSSTGSLIVSNTVSSTTLTASLTRSSVPAGTYQLRIENLNAPTPPATGFTTYGSLGEYTLTANVPRVIVPTAPVISLASTTATYNENETLAIANNATITDEDSANFNTGNLVVDIINDVDSNDRLSVLSQGTGTNQVGVTGDTISYSGINVATIASTNPLRINFTSANVTPAVATAILQQVRFINISDSPVTIPRRVDFTITDNTGLTSATVSLTLNINPINDAPTANNLSFNITSRNTNITLSGSDPEGDSLTFTILSQPVNGTLSGNGFFYVYTLNNLINGSDSFTYHVSDGKANSNVATVNLTITASNSLSEWRKLHGLAADGSQDLEIPACDGIPNLLKYALNLAPNAGDLTRPKSGKYADVSSRDVEQLSGLPGSELTADNRLRFVFIARRNPALSLVDYVIQTSTDLVVWSTYTGSLTRTNLDDRWERVEFLSDVIAPGQMLYLRLLVRPVIVDPNGGI